MEKTIKNLLLGLTLVITIVAGGLLAQPVKAANPTFEEQFSGANAQIVADYFGKNITDEMDADTINSTYINLASSGITDITGFGIFVDLQVLYLGNNNISEIPADFAQLKKLEILSFKHNSIAEIPVALFENTNLKYLSFYNNDISVIPEEIGKLGKLEELDLGTNALITDLPGGFLNLTSLKKLFLNGNSFSNQTSWMEKVFQLTTLEYLDLGVNQITELSPNIDKLTNLTHLDLRENQLVKLPDSFSNCISLVHLYFRSNQLTSLPDNFSNLVNLRTLDLYNNLLPTVYPAKLNRYSFLSSMVTYETQNQLHLNRTVVIDVNSEADITGIDYPDILKLEHDVFGNDSPQPLKLSPAHQFYLTNCVDENMDSVEIEDYLKDGIVQKSGIVYAQVRGVGTGIFPNDSDHSLSVEQLQLNFQSTPYTLIFDLNGTTGTPPVTQILVEGNVGTAVDNPARDGYKFLEWNTAADGSGTTWVPGTTPMLASDVTLYAQWQENETGKSIYVLPKTGGTGSLLMSLITLGAGFIVAAKGSKKK